MPSYARTTPITSRRAAPLAGLLALLLLFCLGGARAEAMPLAGATPAVWSDQGDYRPGSAVTLTGSGWGPGESVHIHVNDSAGATWSRDVDVTAADSGDITDSFSLPDWFVAEYSVTATGATGAVATTSFTDGNVSFALATVDTTLPTGGNLAWTVNWDHFKTSSTCASGKDASSFTSYTGNTKAASTAEPSVGNGQSAQPTGVTATGYALTYWSTSPTSTVHVSTTCVGDNSGTTTLYAHFKATQQATAVTVPDVSATYGGSASLSATLTSGGSGVAGKSIAFSVKGNNVGTATTDSTGKATLSGVSLNGLSAGSYAGAVSATFTADADYLGNSGAGQLTVGQRPITGSLTAADKVYDGTTAATISGRSLAGVVGTDDVSLSGGTATFSDKNVGQGKAVTGSGFSLTGTAKDNYALGSVSGGTASITAKSVTGSFTAADKVYDGSTAATIAGRSLAGVVGSEDVALAGGTATFDTKNAGTAKAVTGTGFALGGADKGNYTLATGALTANATILAKAVTGSFAAADKTYDGTASATIANRSLTGVVGTEDVTLTGGSASFATKDAGAFKDVSGTGFALGGADKGNYALVSSSLVTKASIAAKSLTGHFTAADKVYDGTRDATVTGRSLSGVVGSEDVTLTGGSAAFATKDVGTGKTVSGSGFDLGGADKGNYTLGPVADATASITPKEITGSFTAADKVYDGTTDATVTSRSLNGGVAGDDVSLSGGAAQFDTKAAGRDKAVSGSRFSLAGADTGDYTLKSSSLATTAGITPKEITGSFTAADKVYDGTTDAMVTSGSLAGVVAGDTVSLTGGSAQFDTKDIGAGKTVTGSGFGLGGDDKGDYTLKSSTLTTAASIAARSLTGHFTAADKVYDGNRDATITGRSLSGVVGSEDVALTGGSASFATKDAGQAETVNGTGFTLGGADKGNYVLGPVADATASIAPKEITGSFTAADKVYDGTTAATIVGRSLSGAVADDKVSLGGGGASFDTKAAGTDKPVSGSGFALSGDDKGDYSLKSSSLATIATITPKEITGSFTAADKVYDGTTAATIASRSLSGVVNGDTVSLVGGSAAFDTRDVGQDKAVSGGGFDLGGDDKGDYTLKSSDLATTASITAKEISGHFAAADKVYDGTTDATITDRSLTGVAGGDKVSLVGGSAAFDTQDVGQDKAVSGGGFGLAGDDKGDYTLKSSDLTTTASITAKALTGHFTAADKTYDGTRDASVTIRSLSGIVGTETVTLTGGSAAFDTKDVGRDKTVSGSGFDLGGADKGNYVLVAVTDTTASIGAKSLAGHFTAADKVYDGTADATITGRSLDGVVGAEDVTLSGGTASFSSKDAGKDKTVSGDAFALAGGDKGNYTLGFVADTTASIAPKEIAGHFTAADKVYDGTADATITDRSLSGAVTGDKVSLTGGAARFDSKDVGAGKAVSGSGFALGGDDKGDYTLKSSDLATTASITAKELTGHFTAADKTYDGTRDATITGRSLDGVVGTENVGLTGGSASFDTKDVGTGKTVSGTGFALGGDDKGNYTLKSSSLAATAAITARSLTGHFAAADKVYDGNRGATITDRSLSGVVSGEDVTLTGGAATFDTKDAGAGKSVSGGGFDLGGDDKGNYTLASVADTTAAIMAKAVTGHFTAADKVYDGNTDATITGRSLDGVIGTEDVTLTGGAAAFAGKDAGKDKTVAGSGFGLGGADKGNYTLASVADATASITPKEITGSFTAADKVYDGTPGATIADRALNGAVTGDKVSLTGGSAQFDTKDVGAGKPVTGSGFGLGGDDKGDYTLKSSSLATTASVTAKPLTGSFTAADKVYDGNRDAGITGSSLGAGVVNGDDVRLDASAAKAQFGTKDAGQAKTVTGSGFALAGADKGDYSLAMNTASASITPKSITGAITAADKIYDGTTDAAITGRSLSGTVNGDTVSLSGGTAAFASKDVGQGKPVGGSGFTLAGTDKGDYTLSSVTPTTATITPKSITGSFTAADKIYDGTTAATITGRSLSGQIAGDDVSLSGGTATFADANVGQAKPVSGSGFTLAGADKGDYSLASVAGTTAAITYAPATATCLGAAGHSILQPVNTDGTSVFKQGSTVPAKFRVCDANGNSIGTAGVVSSFRLTQTINGTLATAVNEAVDSTTPGTDFRWSATDQQWIFNMSTKTLKAGYTYVYTVALNDGTSFQFKFGLK